MPDEYRAAEVFVELTTRNKEQVEQDLRNQVAAAEGAQRKIEDFTKGAAGRMAAGAAGRRAQYPWEPGWTPGGTGPAVGAPSGQPLLPPGHPGRGANYPWEPGWTAWGSRPAVASAVAGGLISTALARTSARQTGPPPLTITAEAIGGGGGGGLVRYGGGGGPPGLLPPGVAGAGAAGGPLARSVQNVWTGLGSAGASVSAVGAGLAMAGLATAAVAAAKGMNALTDKQLEYNRSLSHASAQMAFVFAQRDIQELMRNREKGDRLVDSARNLTQAEQSRQENRKETDLLWERLKTSGATFWQLLNNIGHQMSGLEGISRGVNKIVEAIDGTQQRQKQLMMDEYVRDLAAQDTEARKRKDPKWEPARNR